MESKANLARKYFKTEALFKKGLNLLIFSIRRMFTDSSCLNRYLLDFTTKKLRSDIPRFF